MTGHDEGMSERMDAEIAQRVRRRRMRRLIAISALGLIVLVAAIVVAATIGIGDRDATIDLQFSTFLFAGLGLYWVLGALLVLRVDGHRVGWMFAIAAAMLATVFGSWALAPVVAANQPSSPVAGWAMLIGSVLFTPAVILALPAVAIAFPTGRLPGPGWRWPVGVIVALVTLGSLALVVRPGLMDEFLGIENPLTPWLPTFTRSQMESLRWLGDLGNLAILVAAGLGLASVAVRFRRAIGEERLQLKWFVAAITPAVILLPISLSGLFSDVPLIDTLSIAMLPLVALSIAVAILRFHLYDIDRIISRSIGYLLVTGVLGTLFVAVILVLEGLLARFTQGETLAVSASTLAVLVLFQPVRRRVQRVVDRRFDRARYDAERTSVAFAERMRVEADMAAVSDDLRATVSGAMAPSRLGVWVRGGHR